MLPLAVFLGAEGDEDKTLLSVLGCLTPNTAAPVIVVLIVTTEESLLLYKLYSIASLYTCANPCAIEPVRGLIYRNFNVFTTFQAAN